MHELALQSRLYVTRGEMSKGHAACAANPIDKRDGLAFILILLPESGQTKSREGKPRLRVVREVRSAGNDLLGAITWIRKTC